MKLTDKTTVKTLREMIGQKIKTRTSRASIEITGIELTPDETWFLGKEGNRKRRIKLEYISEIWKTDEEEKAKTPNRSKTPQELKEERLRKAEEAEEKKKAEEEARKLKQPATDTWDTFKYPTTGGE